MVRINVDHIYQNSVDAQSFQERNIAGATQSIFKSVSISNAGIKAVGLDLIFDATNEELRTRIFVEVVFTLIPLASIGLDRLFRHEWR